MYANMLKGVLQVAGNRRGSGTATQAITNGQFGTLRNDYSGRVGFAFTTSVDMTVTELARWALAANTSTHSVRIYRQVDQAVLATAIVDCAPPTTNQWVWVAITPFVLPAGSYRIASLEVSGGDQWSEIASAYTTKAGVSITSAAFDSGDTFPSRNAGGAGSTYVPVNFKSF